MGPPLPPPPPGTTATGQVAAAAYLFERPRLFDFYFVFTDALITLLWVYFIGQAHTPRRGLGCRCRCLSPSNRMSAGLLIAASKLHIVYMVYGSRNVLFWASVANSAFIFALMVDAVAFNSGPFKMLRGNNTNAKGILPPLRTRTGAVVSFVGAMRWVFYGGRDRTAAMAAFVINPSSNDTLVDDDDDNRDDGKAEEAKMKDEKSRGSSFSSPNSGSSMRDGGKILPALLGAPGDGAVLLRYGPCNCFRANLTVTQWNNFMLDSSFPAMVHWLKVNSVPTPDHTGQRGRALLCMRSDGALRSIVLQAPDVRTIFDLCGTSTSKAAYIIEDSTRQGCGEHVQYSRTKSNDVVAKKTKRSEDSLVPASPPPSPPVIVRDADLPPMLSLNGEVGNFCSNSAPFTQRSATLSFRGTKIQRKEEAFAPPPVPPDTIPWAVGGHVSMSAIVEKLRASASSGGTRKRKRRVSFCRDRSTSAFTNSIHRVHSELKAHVFEIVMKMYPGDPKNYWYYAEYPEWGLSPTVSQSAALKQIIEHLNSGTKARALHYARCKNAFESGDHQRLAVLRGSRLRRRRRKRSDHWLELRS